MSKICRHSLCDCPHFGFVFYLKLDVLVKIRGFFFYAGWLYEGFIAMSSSIVLFLAKSALK